MSTTGPVGFEVHLPAFSGPFDLLLRLITRQQLDLSEVALAVVADEFVAYLRGLGPVLDLGVATEFLVVATTLLELKASRLLPGPAADDPADQELLEARDLLFARLLQYRAFRSVTTLLAGLLIAESRYRARPPALEPQWAAVLPRVVLEVSPGQLAALAAAALSPREEPTVAVGHVHQSLDLAWHREQVLALLRTGAGQLSFAELCAGVSDVLAVVARFLTVLDLVRDGQAHVAQEAPLAQLSVRWTAA